MKAFLIYWTIGCAVVGLPMGQMIHDCPGAKVNTYEFVALVSIWPSFFFGALGGIGKEPLPKQKCYVSE